MNALVKKSESTSPIPLILVSSRSLETWANKADAQTQAWIKQSGFDAKINSFLSIPHREGGIQWMLVGVADTTDSWSLAGCALTLPAADYELVQGPVAFDLATVAFGFAMGAYQFTRYRAPKRAAARLCLPDNFQSDSLNALLEASCLSRDLVNTPAEDMGPEHLSAVVQTQAQRFGAKVQEWVGEDLLKHNFPAVHAVGRASHRPPRLIELTWGNDKHPKLAVVGKGVCFDTGGLNMKMSEGMRWMKKDMGGSAHAIALAQLIMAHNLPVKLSLLIPAVENAMGPNSYRPGDVIRTRAGMSIEIDNTDAEGRVVLCDALTYAAEGKPDLIIDFATLTGAARIALGAELPALYSNSDELAASMMQHGKQCDDPVWHMPLWKPYLRMLDSTIADMANSGPSRLAGSITAALYLSRFVPESLPWIHMDVFAWNDVDRPGRPKGGEAQGLRATFAMLEQRYR